VLSAANSVEFEAAGPAKSINTITILGALGNSSSSSIDIEAAPNNLGSVSVSIGALIGW